MRAETGTEPIEDIYPAATCVIDQFAVCSEEKVRRIITNSPTKSCDLDPIPTFILKEMLDVLLPFITLLCNTSLQEGNLPVTQRHALVTPILKHGNLDHSNLKNYRPVSNLTFISKVIERLVAEQINKYLSDNKMLSTKQSAYRKCHSTETALLSVMSDIITAIDHSQVTLLCLLDLSAAFGTVDIELLLHRLRTFVGMDGAPLSWITSFLTNRTQQELYRGAKSASRILRCGVPQGSVLGPLLFSLYMTELADIVA